MSIEKPNDFDLEQAYLHGLDSGFDIAAAEDLGIPSTPATFTSHVTSGRQVAANPQVTEASSAYETAHQTNVELYHLQTDEQRAMIFAPEEQARIGAAKQLAREAIKHTRER